MALITIAGCSQPWVLQSRCIKCKPGKRAARHGQSNKTFWVYEIPRPLNYVELFDKLTTAKGAIKVLCEVADF